MGTGQQRRRNEQAVEDGQTHGDSFPSPVAACRNRSDYDCKSCAHCKHWTDAEKSQAGTNPDEFRDQGQKVSENQVGQGEKSPEFTEAVEDQLCVPPVSYGA